ncbi:carboxypeptidase-like regulatory domain-containing protein [Flavihumibacter sediminis]|nr:carboxypeptidase-like regulatory domain-containing protein [Flavihumibacter sediminis]
MKNVLQRSFLFACLLFITAITWAQNPVSGKVSDEKGDPVANASVLVKGTNIGTATNAAGEFSLTVPSTATTLVITSLSYEEQEVAITGTTLNIVLKLTGRQMDEVVVVGYGVQKVTKVSGAISTIKGTEIEKMKPVRAEDALQG